MPNGLLKALLILAFLTCGGFVIDLSLPYIIKSAVHYHINHNIKDISDITLPEPEVGVDYIRYKKISLDTDQINTIGALTLIFTPQGLISGVFDKAIIDDAEIIASIDKDHQLLLDGWLNKDGFGKALFVAPKQISIRNADLTMLTEEYGGITLSFNATAQLKHDTYGLPRYEYQSQFSSEQRNITLHGNASGSFTYDNLVAQVDFERGKVFIPEYDMKMTRLSGSGQIDYSKAGLNFFSELRSGGLRLSVLPWQNTSINYTIDNNEPQLYLSAQSVGIEGIELAMSYANNEISTKIHTPSEDIWNEYIDLNNIYGEDLDKLVGLLSLLQTEIELE